MTDIEAYLSKPHTHHGGFTVFITEDTAENIVDQVFDFTESLDTNGFDSELKEMRLGIDFIDRSKLTRNKVGIMLTPTYYPYHRFYPDTSRESMLANSRETFYE